MRGVSSIQFLTIWLGWGNTDGPVHFNLTSRAVDRVGEVRKNAIIHHEGECWQQESCRGHYHRHTDGQLYNYCRSVHFLSI